MAIVANDTNDYVDQMILLTKRLCEMAQAQLVILEQRDIEANLPFTDEASRLAATYAQETQRIANNPAFLREVSPSLKNALKESTQKFRELMARHERALERNLKLTEGLVRAIAEEAVSSRPSPISYAPNGAKLNPTRANTTAITLDRKA